MFEQESYLDKKRVSQVAELTNNTLIVAVWDESGYYYIDRSSIVPNPVKIEDTTMKMNFYCTDLVNLPIPKVSTNAARSKLFLKYS